MHKFSSLKLQGFVLVISCFVVNLHAQRLPQAVNPEHYQLVLIPNLKTATFTGSEKIDVVLKQPMDAITLNAAQITFKTVTADLNGQTLTANVTQDAQKQQATFHFDKTLPAGPLTLSIAYSGILNGQLRGFYLSKTKRRNYAVTQFEPTDARRAFPSFDEPAFKATYSVSLVVNKGDTAISNTNIISDMPGPIPGKHTIRFATTPKMSTYLVAFLVGDFQCTSGASDGVPIRVCATPDKVQYTKYALNIAEYVLHYYDTYFGIKYPMPKLDLIALPDFEAGAMENFGAITYRETDLLIDPVTASLEAKKRVGVVVAHEMAHQWFGDMVTMQWWNNIWLNEGFATWMEYKPIAAMHPEWNLTQDVAMNLNNTLNLDAQRTTRTIRANANTPDEINEMFDGITYGKAAAMLNMVEHYEGVQTFREGVHNYLQAHMYANADAQDFWNAQTEVSRKPIDKIMKSFVAQPGVPLLTFGEQKGGSVQVSQERFFLNPTVATSRAQTWYVPVCFKAEEDGDGCEVLSAAQQMLRMPQAPFLFGDEEGVGYYRSSYPQDVYARILDNIETDLTPEERIGFIGDEWAKVRANTAPVGQYLNLVAAVRNDQDADVISTALRNVAVIDAQIASTPVEHDALENWVRKTFEPAYNLLGAPQDTDSPAKKELRATLFGFLGDLGNDPEVIAQAKTLAEEYLHDQTSVEPTLAQEALIVAAIHGDAAFFDQLQNVFETSNDPELQETALRLLGEFSEPSLATRALNFAVSGKVRNQDSVLLIGGMLSGRRTRDVTWQYVQGHWPQVHAQLTEWMEARLVSGASSFCTADKRDEVMNFFTTHKMHAAARTLLQTRDHINDCIDLRSMQGENLQNWASGQ
ncbi:MAG TPA: M1 family metallopeptidase [Acidobacteriaceae bacterium]|nr:M1 family metallopeptidase [Acidobacteriaceae bacterium]